MPQICAVAILESLSLNLWIFCCPVYSPPPHPDKGKPSLKISKHPLLLSFLVCYSLHRFLLTVSTKPHLLLAVILGSTTLLLTWLRHLRQATIHAGKAKGSLLIGSGGIEVSTKSVPLTVAYHTAEGLWTRNGLGWKDLHRPAGSSPQPWAGTHPTRSGCPKPHQVALSTSRDGTPHKCLRCIPD